MIGHCTLNVFLLTGEIKTDGNFVDESIPAIELPLWNMWFDGSKHTTGVGIGI